MSNKSMKVLEAEDGNYNVLNFFFSDRSDFVGIFKFRETGFFFFFLMGKLKRICKRSLLLCINARDTIKKALDFVAFLQIPFHHACVGR